MSTPRWAQSWALLLLTCVTVNEVVGASHGSGTEGTRSTPHPASHMAPAPPTLTLMQLGGWLQEQQPTEFRIPFSEIDVMGSKSMRSTRGPDEPKTTAISTTAICAPPYTLPLQITSGPPCNITCVVCTTDSGHTWIANASSSFNHTFDKSVGFGNPNANQTLALFDALFRVLGSMDATFTTVDCACFALTVPEAQTCTLRVAFCAYIAPIDASGNIRLLYRARAWDTANSEYTGASSGYKSLADGHPTQEAAEIEAADNLRSNFPNRSCGDVPPIVIFPGFTSSTIEYTMENSPPPPGHPFCPRNAQNSSWSPLYPPSGQDLLQMQCYFSKIESSFDPATSTFSPARKGLEVRTVGFGGFDGMPGFVSIYSMFRIAGWEEGKTIFGVPFDWRMPSPALEGTFTEMRTLIENVTALNGGRKVTVWAFSGGPQPTLGFMHRQTQVWKDQHIAWFVATSPVWGGVGVAPAAYISGATTAVVGPVNASVKLAFEEIRGIARGLPAVPWYFPRAGTNSTTSWTKDEPVVKTKTKTYSAFDAAEMLSDLGASAEEIAAHKFLESEPDLGQFAHPGVNTLVTFGTGFPSLVGLEYDADFTASDDLVLPISVTTETGDNLVPLRSSLRSTEWALPLKAAGKQFIQREYPGQPHAACFPLGLIDGDDADIGTKCFREVIATIRGGLYPTAQ
eukprot:m.248855 g.248855  ORF g.248855 m.248855 type:complete len:683 (+) comp26476_c1_seq6:107-2155(+)